jgi:hypothetical protein
VYADKYRSLQGEYNKALTKPVSEVKKLLDKGLPLNASTLIRAVEAGRNDLVEMMIERDSTIVNTKNKDGLTGLHAAAKSGQMGIAKMLLKNGADINAQSNVGDTPLHMAWWNNAPNLKPVAGKVRADNTEMIKYLEANGARNDITNMIGAAPHQYVAGAANPQMQQRVYAGQQQAAYTRYTQQQQQTSVTQQSAADPAGAVVPPKQTVASTQQTASVQQQTGGKPVDKDAVDALTSAYRYAPEVTAFKYAVKAAVNGGALHELQSVPSTKPGEFVYKENGCKITYQFGNEDPKTGLKSFNVKVEGNFTGIIEPQLLGEVNGVKKYSEAVEFVDGQVVNSLNVNNDTSIVHGVPKVVTTQDISVDISAAPQAPKVSTAPAPAATLGTVSQQQAKALGQVAKSKVADTVPPQGVVKSVRDNGRSQ